MTEPAAFVTNAIPVELSAATARGFLQRIKSEAKSDNLDTTVGKLQLEWYHHHHHHHHSNGAFLHNTAQ
jgi:hypothetical protein